MGIKLIYQHVLKTKEMIKFLTMLNFRWQNFIEDMFGMGNFSCPSYRCEYEKQTEVELKK